MSTFAHTHMRKDVHVIRQLHCQWRSGQCHAKRAENAASVHNTYLDKIVCYLPRLFIRDRKLKHQVSKLSALKLGVCSKMNVYYIFVCIFVQIRQKSNFQLSQGSAATYRRYSGKCYMNFVGNLLLFPAVKEFWKSVKNWQSYRHEFGVLFFVTQFRRLKTVPGHMTPPPASLHVCYWLASLWNLWGHSLRGSISLTSIWIFCHILHPCPISLKM